MTSNLSPRATIRTGLQILCGFAFATAMHPIDPAVADTAASGTSPQRLVSFKGSGSVTVVPHSDAPQGCLAAGKGICTAKYEGTGRSDLFPGIGELRGDFTIDFTKPETSGTGTCFPELVSGNYHTARGDFKNVEQGPLCIPAASAGVRPGFDLQSRPGILIGGTGAYAHLYATMQVSISASPGLILFHDDGVATGIEGGSD